MVRTYEKAEKQISEISVWKTKQLETEIVKIVLHTHIHCVFRDFLAVKALLPSWPLSFPRSKDAKDSWIVLQRFSQNSEFLTNVLASLRAVFGALFKLLAPSKNLHKGGTASLTPPPPCQHDSESNPSPFSISTSIKWIRIQFTSNPFVFTLVEQIHVKSGRCPIVWTYILLYGIKDSILLIFP